jgi:hypothetical protein
MSWQLLPNIPEAFIFRNTQLAGLPKIKKGILPCPEEILKTNNLFVNYNWDVFYNISALIKKRLKGKYPQRIMAARDNDLLLFSFEYRLPEKTALSGKFILTFRKRWVIDSVPPFQRRIRVSGNCPWKAYSKIMEKLRKKP